jgi:hypothetical protein
MAAEAQDIAKEIAYGTLREDRQVDDGYLAANRLYVDLQLSLAGYRLGNMLQMFFDRGSARIGFSLAEAIVWGINAVAFVIIVVYLTVLRQVRPRTR